MAGAIAAELPGLDEKNVEVKFADGMLTIKGEKREEKEEKKKDFYLSERRFGSFQRSFQVPDGVDADKIATMLLADLGAEVVKVEHPRTGDAYRGLRRSGPLAISGPVNFAIEHANRGKRSVGIDVASPDVNLRPASRVSRPASNSTAPAGWT